jgi:hypothetical protein
MKKPLLIGFAVLAALACVSQGLRTQDVVAQERKPDPASLYELRGKRVAKDQVEWVRFHRGTGEAWRKLRGEWKKVTEADAPARGDFDVRIEGEDADANFFVVRIDKATGKCWILAGPRWQAIPEARD